MNSCLPDWQVIHFYSNCWIEFLSYDSKNLSHDIKWTMVCSLNPINDYLIFKGPMWFLFRFAAWAKADASLLTYLQVLRRLFLDRQGPHSQRVPQANERLGRERNAISPSAWCRAKRNAKLMQEASKQAAAELTARNHSQQASQGCLFCRYP